MTLPLPGGGTYRAVPEDLEVRGPEPGPVDSKMGESEKGDRDIVESKTSAKAGKKTWKPWRN